MRWPSAHSNQLRLGGAGEVVRDEDLARRTTLRWGELVALRLRDVDLDTGSGAHAVRKFAELQNGERVSGRPKSDAGFRTVACPPCWWRWYAST
jgi:hypothetical protein